MSKKLTLTPKASKKSVTKRHKTTFSIRTTQNKKAFTVVELTVVIIVIGILAALIIVGFGAWRKQIATNTVKSDLTSVTAAMESARNFADGYPTSLPSSFTNSDGVVVSYVTGDATKYCVEAYSSNYPLIRYFVDSSAGSALTLTLGTCLGGVQYDGKYTAFIYDLNLAGCVGTTVQLPVNQPTSSGGSVINWGDSSQNTLSGSNQSHTYASKGVYTVLYEGPISVIDTVGIASNARTCLQKISQWSDSATPSRLSFANSTNLVYVPKPPSSVTNLSGAFNNARVFNQPIGDWDMSNVTNIDSMFAGAWAFNQPLANWDISNVTRLNNLFTEAQSFNQPIGNWNVSNVTSLHDLFTGAVAFNQPLNSWNTSNVTTMHGAFGRETCGCPGAASFNQPLNNWNTAKVTDMSNMFEDAFAFNQNISNWNTSNVTNMGHMFDGASVYNQPVNSWDVSKVTNMDQIFAHTNTFNQPLSSWNTGNVTSMVQIFHTALAFNQPINTWNVSKVTNGGRMFRESGAFNQPLNNWDTSNFTSMDGMFASNFVYAQNISTWNVSKVTNVFNANKRNGYFVENQVALPNSYLPTFPQ